LELDVKMNRIGGKIIELKKVYKAFGDRTILKGFDYTFRTGERVGIVGKNGCGKTTFLNIISGKEPPDSGKVNIGETVVFGFYSQAGLQVKEDKRVIEVVREHADVIQLADGSKVSAGQFLQLFQFPPSLQQTYVSKLSGGERRRLHLLTVLIRNPNFLILDEPTNDLDLLTLATLEEFLLHYRGCLVIVSHDRYFMDKLVDHLLVFEGEGKIRDYNGTYSELRIDQEEREKAADQAAVLERKAREQEAPVKETARKKLTYKERLEFERLESEIAALEAKKADLTGLLNGGSSDHAALSGWAHELESVLQQLDEKSMRWLELSELA
ncbi:MAG: ATP-binding cassette domain-containing protein, partial [Bacteroidota bacterium]